MRLSKVEAEDLCGRATADQDGRYVTDDFIKILCANWSHPAASWSTKLLYLYPIEIRCQEHFKWLSISQRLYSPPPLFVSVRGRGGQAKQGLTAAGGNICCMPRTQGATVPRHTPWHPAIITRHSHKPSISGKVGSQSIPEVHHQCSDHWSWASSI